jgi:two-component sensor histidine kinase
VQDDVVVIVWTERGGPTVVAPEGEGGFGSKLLTRSLAAQLRGSIERNWSEEGAIITLRMDQARLAS